MKHYLAIFVLLIASFTACKNQSPQEPQMILEGWIDSDGYPTVLLHKSYILDNATEQTLEEVVENQLIMFGRVAINDGEKEVVLTGRLDTMYLPPYTYSTLNMQGETGKTYTVTATYKNFRATATTTIPPVAKFDSIRISSIDEDETRITGYLTVADYPTTYYALFIRLMGQKQFRLCPLSVFDSNKADGMGKIELMVYNLFAKPSNNLTEMFSFHFPKDSTVYQLKLARIDKESYRFWSGYSSQQLTQGVFFVPVYRNIQGNVEGGIGNFTGMGSTTYTIRANSDTTYICIDK